MALRCWDAEQRGERGTRELYEKSVSESASSLQVSREALRGACDGAVDDFMFNLLLLASCSPRTDWCVQGHELCISLPWARGSGSCIVASRSFRAAAGAPFWICDWVQDSTRILECRFSSDVMGACTGLAVAAFGHLPRRRSVGGKQRGPESLR